MASKENLLEQFRAQILAFDEDSLATASSKGLVRRAKKELQKGLEPILQETAEGLVLEVDSQQVSISAKGLLETTCTCPATDVCRHILVSCLWLRSQLPINPSESPLPAEPPQMPAYSLEEIIAWASKPIFNKALTFAEQNSAKTEITDTIVVHFPQANVTCRYFPATALTGMLCSCKARQVCVHRVAAVCTVLKDQGTPLPEPPAADNSPSTIASAPQIITNTIRLLETTVTVGLLHLSDISHQQVVTLSVSAQAAKLPRLALALRGIANDIDLIIKRNAAADSDRLFWRIACAYALGVALEKTAPHYPLYLVGQSQSRYESVGTLNLVGMGAYPWRTQSGYGGLTVLFWDPTAQQWCSWSESRPLFHNSGFDPVRAYRQPLIWEGIAHPADASQHSLSVYNARRNYQQRLSSSRQTMGVRLRPTQPDDWQSMRLCFQDWHSLGQHITSTRPIGLAQDSPLDRFVILQPTQWGTRQFDPVQQRFTWELFDTQEQSLFLRLKFSDIDATAINRLENLKLETARIIGIIGSVTLEKGTLFCSPIALCRRVNQGQSTIINLYFSSQQKVSTSKTSALPPDILETDSGHAPSSIDLLTASLQRMAEQGHSCVKDTLKQELTQHANHAEKIGMGTITNEIRHLLQSSHQQTPQLLKIRYLCYLYQQAADMESSYC